MANHHRDLGSPLLSDLLTSCVPIVILAGGLLLLYDYDTMDPTALLCRSLSTSIVH